MTKPIVIYIAERGDHADMAYSSLLKQIIEKCEDNGLSVRAFSEIGSQEFRVNAFSGGGIEEQLKKLTNAPSREMHIETTKFLDDKNLNGERRLIPMGSLKERWQELVPQTWANLSEEIKVRTPKDLLEYFKEQGAIDNDVVLQVMEEDLKNWKDKTAIEYYDMWGGCLNYKSIHQTMTRDIRRDLADRLSAPDVIVMIAGNAHIVGLDQQLPEFTDSQKLVTIGKHFSNECTDAISEATCGKSNDIIKGVGKEIVEFEFEETTKKAIIPASIANIINEKSQSKRLQTDKGSLAEKILEKRAQEKESQNRNDGR